MPKFRFNVITVTNQFFAKRLDTYEEEHTHAQKPLKGVFYEYFFAHFFVYFMQ